MAHPEIACRHFPFLASMPVTKFMRLLAASEISIGALLPTPFVPTPFVPTPFVPTPFVPTPFVPTPFVPAAAAGATLTAFSRGLVTM